MKISARNSLKGTISAITVGPVKHRGDDQDCTEAGAGISDHHEFIEEAQTQGGSKGLRDRQVR